MKTALKWEEKYLNLLKEQGKYKLIINLSAFLLIIILDPTTCGSADILELLNKAASSYATAIRIAPKDSRGHIGLGIVMEEMFYVGDLFGHKPIEVLREYVLYMYVCVCVSGKYAVLTTCVMCVLVPGTINASLYVANIIYNVIKLIIQLQLLFPIIKL